MLLVFKPSSVKRGCFWRFLPEQLCSNLSRQIKSLLSSNWQVLKVLVVKFQASTLDQCHHSFINLFCKSASKPLDTIRARSAVCFLQTILQLSKTSSRPPLRLRFLYGIYTLRMYTNTARSIEAEQRLCSEALTSDIGLLQNFRAYKKWIPLSSNFWAINSRRTQLITVNGVFQRVWKMFGFFITPKIFWLCSTYSVKLL